MGGKIKTNYAISVALTQDVVIIQLSERNNSPSKNMSTKFTIVTDALQTTIEAANEDEAAVKFAAKEAVYRDYEINDANDLVEAAEDMGGWAKISAE